MSVIWSKFFWQDWANDPALRLCSLGAQGLWMRMLCVAAEANPIGYVAVNGQALGVTDISRLAGVTETEATALIGELDRYGVFSRTRTGVIYSRRMIRDAKKRVTTSENGKKGGNPEIRRGLMPKADRVRPFRRSDSPAKTERVFQKTDGHCWWCKVQLSKEVFGENFFHVDHLVPVCDGGTNDEENLVPSCAKCNHLRARKDWVISSDSNNAVNGDTKPHKPEASKPEAREEILSPSFHSGESEARPPEKPPRKLKSSTPNRTRIDPEAVDGPAEYAEFEKSGLPMGDLERVWLNFRDHHASKGSLMADWLAAWRTWLRREVEFRSRNAGSAKLLPFGKPEKRVLQ